MPPARRPTDSRLPIPDPRLRACQRNLPDRAAVRALALLASRGVRRAHELAARGAWKFDRHRRAEAGSGIRLYTGVRILIGDLWRFTRRATPRREGVGSQLRSSSSTGR